MSVTITATLPRQVSTPEAAAIIGRDPSALRRAANHPDGWRGVRPVRIGRRSYAWPLDALLAALAERDAIPPTGSEG